MITAGRNIRQKNDPLQKLTLERLHKSIVNPKPEIQNKINQLRKVLTVSKEGYRIQKTSLPYVCCGNFNPPYRRTENFANISYFIIDIDHLGEKGLDINKLKEKLKQDLRIELMFVSPGGDGLKVFFRLAEKCYDAGKYSVFYKAFALAFSRQYNLEQVVDKATSDVSRACFISYDEDAYFNPDPETVNMAVYVDFGNLLEVKEKEGDFKKAQEEIKKHENKDQSKATKSQIDGDLLQQIKSKLNPNIKTKKEKIIFVPEELEPAAEKVKSYLEKHKIEVLEIGIIHYGKKFKFAVADGRWAEINLHYGKKGFSVVKTTKSGSDADLVEICYKLMCEIFY
jgi:hypothetical protein